MHTCVHVRPFGISTGEPVHGQNLAGLHELQARFISAPECFLASLLGPVSADGPPVRTGQIYNINSSLRCAAGSRGQESEECLCCQRVRLCGCSSKTHSAAKAITASTT